MLKKKQLNKEPFDTLFRLTKSETHVTEATSFILELLRKRNVKQNLEVFSEIILIAKILHQRFRETDGIKVKKNISIELAKKEILKTVEKDQYYNLLKQFIKDYSQFREKEFH